MKRDAESNSQTLRRRQPVAGRVTGSLVVGACLFLSARPNFGQTVAAMQTDTAVCSACHGLRGEGSASGVPRLAGQNADYMAHALSMFKAGTRSSPIMQPIAQGLSDTRMREVADYFSKQDAPNLEAGATRSPLLVVAGKRLAEVGAANVRACFSCHGGQGNGDGARFPAIAGEPANFVTARLHEFQARARQGAPRPGTMTAVAATLDEDQIEAAAAYLSGLGPTGKRS